jgi:hypothetical protein
MYEELNEIQELRWTITHCAQICLKKCKAIKYLQPDVIKRIEWFYIKVCILFESTDSAISMFAD